MAKKKETKPGYGRLLDAWTPPPEAGEPIGCVATTFTFSPVFFEEECLSRFLQLETDPDEDGPLYILEREEKLAQVSCAAALVDQHHCKGSRSLRWDMLLARVPNAILHSKVSLLYWANWVRVIVASANLTEDGYRRNQEVFGVLDFPNEGGDIARSCLTDVIEFLRYAGAFAKGGAAQLPPGLARWNAFLNKAAEAVESWSLPESEKRSTAVSCRPVFSGPGRANVMDSIRKLWTGYGPPGEAWVFSPFFDPVADHNKPAEALWKLLRQRGEAKAVFCVTAEEIPGKSGLLLHAPESLKKAQPGRDTTDTGFCRLKTEPDRTFHAKGMWIEDDADLLYLIGSSNFTTAGLGLNSTHANVEANLAYLCSYGKHWGSYPRVGESFPDSEEITVDSNTQWLPAENEDEIDDTETVSLPAAFSSAVYDIDERNSGVVTVVLTSDPPQGWRLLNEDNDSPVLADADWRKSGSRQDTTIPWGEGRPPSGFWVTWHGAKGKAWLPVHIKRMASLPPPDLLRNLPLEMLINILTSSRPLRTVLREYLRKREANAVAGVSAHEIVDPHKRVDTSGFLLQRTRRVSWGLSALRSRLEQPVATEEGLRWRLYGPVGVMAFKDALLREAGSQEEQSFLLSELALELSRAKPKTAKGCLSAARVRNETRKLIPEIRACIPNLEAGASSTLKRYIKQAFEVIGS